MNVAMSEQEDSRREREQNENVSRRCDAFSARGDRDSSIASLTKRIGCLNRNSKNPTRM